ncbi:MAG: AAA family ATPase, partial [Hamadaea sp.]|nr:AAA family ATPase [Hamadaea sp.]
MALLERASALADLDRWLGEARSGHGRLVLVGGEAGVGKTSLVHEFGERHRRGVATGGRWLWCGCDPLTTPQPLGPLAEVAADLGGPIGELFGRDRPAGHVPARDAVFADVLDRLHGRGAARVLVVEDLHWADEMTVDLLRYLVRRIGRLPALVVGTFRHDGLGQNHPLRLLLGDLATAPTVRRLEVAPLSADAVAALAVPAGLNPQRLYAATAGNPFYVTEAIAAGGDGIPATVRDAVLARAARLSDRARQVLDVAALITAPVEVSLLLEVASAAGPSADECVRAGMLRERPGGVEFRHELARLAVDEAIAPAQRTAIHRRTLAVLLARPATTHDPA